MESALNEAEHLLSNDIGPDHVALAAAAIAQARWQLAYRAARGDVFEAGHYLRRIVRLEARIATETARLINV